MSAQYQHQNPSHTHHPAQKLQPTYHGYVGNFADIEDLLFGIRIKKYPLVTTKWRQEDEHHRDHIHLAGNTFVWRTYDTTLIDGIWWSNGLCHYQRSEENWELTQVTQIEVLDSEFEQRGWITREGQFAQNEFVRKEAIPNAYAHYSDLGHLIGRYNLSANHPSRGYRERLVRQRLHYKCNAGEFLIASYYFQNDLAQLNRPARVLRTCIGKIESKEDLRRLIQLVQELPGEYPLVPNAWLNNSYALHPLGRAHGLIFVWRRQASCKHANFNSVPQWSQNIVAKTLTGNEGNIKEMLTSFFVQVTGAERAASTAQARLAIIANMPDVVEWSAVPSLSQAARELKERPHHSPARYLLISLQMKSDF